ncbi:Methyltransferase domain protein [Novipirellula aureliae]|uniref:Methyltransferase domain protein n=1 Tax=Novipirellula aureliae TaxID=2527966 RepID=A0A5C6E847_9BACT|nr:class I SAM-dependent methyltransferase [Novipirellula aureliae]TWU43861.1 Methyltransferase domain protein [Novipirellula aureliae]
MSAQDQTLVQYHELMQINAVSHLLRTAGQTGILRELQSGQKTIGQLCEALSLSPEPTGLLLDALISMGFIQKYGDDHALSPAAGLLCNYDADLGDGRWARLADAVAGRRERQAADLEYHYEHVAATQWIHTPAAIEAAEILNLGGEGELEAPQILDLGCGAGVWSCAMVHRVGQLGAGQGRVVAVDLPGPLAAAKSMAASINVTDHFSTIESDPLALDDLEPEYDIVLLAQRLFALGSDEQDRLLKKAVSAVRDGGRLVVIDLFRGPTKPNLTESVEALKLQLDTPAGGMKTLEQAQTQMRSVGMGQIQFSYLPASRVGMGMLVGSRGGG